MNKYVLSVLVENHSIVDIDVKSMTIEITGDEEKISAFIEMMKPHGIKEIVRTGLTALERG